MPLLVALLLACGSPPPPPAAPVKPPAPILDARAYPAVLAVGDRLRESGPFRVRWVGLRDPMWDEGEETAPADYDPEPEASLAGGPWELVDAEGGFQFRDARAYTDVPHRGCRTLRLVHYSLGAHCCDTNYLFTHCPEGASVTTIFSPDNNGDADVYAADVDQDGNVEFVYTDWTFYDFIPLEDVQRSVPDRAPFRRLLAWTRGGWHAAPLTRGRKAFYARSLADTLALRPKDATDDWEIGTVGTRRGLVVGVYSHLGGASRPRLLRDIRKALQAEVPRELLVHFDGSPCIDPAEIRSTKDSLQVDCVEDAPALAKVIVEQLDGFDASRVEVVWSSRDAGSRRLSAL